MLVFPYLAQYLQRTFQNSKKDNEFGSIKYTKAILDLT